MGGLHNLEASSALIEQKVGARDTNLWSEEHDRLPLKQRLKVLLARSELSDLFPDSGSEKDEISNFPPMPNDGFVRNDPGKCDAEYYPDGRSLLEGKAKNWSAKCLGEWSDCNDHHVTKANIVRPNIIPAEKVNGVAHSSHSQSIVSTQSVLVDILGAGKSSSSLVGNYRSGGNLQPKETQNENHSDFVDELDHVVLKERQRLLLSSKTLRLTNTSLEEQTERLPAPAVDSLGQQSAKIIKEEFSYADKEFAMVESHFCRAQKTSVFSSSNAVMTALPYSDHRSFRFGCHCQGSKTVESGNMTTIEDKDRVWSLEKNFARSSTDGGWNSFSNKSTVHNVAISKFVNVKVEPLDINETSIRKVSVAPLPIEDMNPLKTESGIPNDFDEYKIDHMLLRERMKLLPSYMPCVDVRGMEYSGKILPSAVDYECIAKESPRPLRINRPRKRRKTATDNVETALEEDAPGLLQVLIQKGVSVDDIKLYGERESDDTLDDFPTEESFTELEAIISKIFSRRDSLLKLPALRCIKGEKASYCLASLFSLVEQARYLQSRKWPVEWGWCRDLQSFIFVFARHNRIVLERPEYGFATYFFELIDSLPINWQIKRLVTAMKLTTCSRATLTENKSLVVGEDLTEGEARVLREYGWIPNSGLGSMLNYCDRVVHDRKTEDPLEWRSKIGKLLVDGYNGGCIVATDVPKKLAEYSFSEDSPIKVETI